MENLTLNEFERVLISVLTEAEELEDYEFTEEKDELKIKDKTGCEISVLLDGYYSTYQKEKDMMKVVDMAIKHIKEEFGREKTRKKTEDAVFDLKNLLESVLMFNSDSPSECATCTTPTCIQDMLDAIKNVFDEAVMQKKELLEKVNGFFVSKKYQEMYSSYAYSEVLNMLFVYHVGDFNAEEDVVNGCIPVSKIQELGITIQELYKHAWDNLLEQYPVSTFEAAGDGVIITNNICKYGASAFMYPMVLDKIAEKHKCDLLIVPLSMDAVYVTPYKGSKDWLMGRLEELIKKGKDMVVSDKIIRYNYENKNLFFYV